MGVQGPKKNPKVIFHSFFNLETRFLLNRLQKLNCLVNITYGLISLPLLHHPKKLRLCGSTYRIKNFNHSFLCSFKLLEGFISCCLTRGNLPRKQLNFGHLSINCSFLSAAQFCTACFSYFYVLLFLSFFSCICPTFFYQKQENFCTLMELSTMLFNIFKLKLAVCSKLLI